MRGEEADGGNRCCRARRSATRYKRPHRSREASAAVRAAGDKNAEVTNALDRVEVLDLAFLLPWRLVYAGKRPRSSLLPERRCKPQEAFSNLRGRPGSKTENKRRLKLRLDAIK